MTSDEHPRASEDWRELATALTGDEIKDLRNLVRDAVVGIVLACPDEKADPWTRNWLERAKYIGLYHGPTEGSIERIIDWLEGNHDPAA